MKKYIKGIYILYGECVNSINAFVRKPQNNKVKFKKSLSYMNINRSW